jgi:hypothetical protein
MEIVVTVVNVVYENDMKVPVGVDYKTWKKIFLDNIEQLMMKDMMKD